MSEAQVGVAGAKASADDDHDPLDGADYDPIEHLNAMFTHPSHLSRALEVRDTLRAYQATLDTDIDSLVARQTASNATSIQRIQAAKTDMAELFSKIDDVRERAMQTETAITEMTAEIKQLDNAKRNLTVSMTALKRLQMLTTAYEQLRAMSKTRQYRECAQLLAAVIQLMAHFRSYRSVDQIATLSRNVADIQRELVDQVCKDFEVAFSSAGTKGETPQTPQQAKHTLAEGCQVMEALGDANKGRLITWYCNTQLREYRQVFRSHEEAGSLDNLSRRYAWFKRLLRTYDEEHAAIFPASWKVSCVLANAFCEGTREDFKGILARATRAGQTLDVNLLLSCLQETLDFEQYLDKRLNGPSRASLDTLAASQEQQQQQQHQPAYTQTISGAFEPYLSIWVDEQDRQLAASMRRYRQAPLKPADEEFTPQLVIASSTELFTFYRHALAQCAKLSTGNSLLELFKVFAKYLDMYAQQVLLNYTAERAPSSSAVSAGTGAGASSSMAAMSMSMSIEDVVMVLNTADYCYTTTTQLEEKLRSRIDEPLRKQIDLQSQADAFMGIASSCVRLLVRGVVLSLEPAWREMRNLPWARLDNVGDNSAYVVLLLDNIKGRSGQVLQVLQKQQYARAFADHLVESVSGAFLGNVYQCRPVSEIAAEQMLLDAYTLKTGMNDVISPPPPSYTRRLATSFQKVDNLLKVTQVPPTPPEGFVQAYLLHIADTSDANFKRILDLKGVRGKSEQNALLELFAVHRASSRFAGGLQRSNPVVAQLQSEAGVGAGAAAGASGGSGLSSSLPTGLQSAIASGVERLGSPVLGSSTGAQSQGQGVGDGGQNASSDAGGNLNENLKGIGRFFRRDFGGRLGRSSVDGASR